MRVLRNTRSFSLSSRAGFRYINIHSLTYNSHVAMMRMLVWNRDLIISSSHCGIVVAVLAQQAVLPDPTQAKQPAVFANRTIELLGRRRDSIRGIHESHVPPGIMDMTLVAALGAVWAE